MSLMNLLSIENELAAHIGVDTTQELSTVDLDLLINRAYFDILNFFDLRAKEKTITFPTVVGISLYCLPDDLEALRQLSVEDLIDSSHSIIARFGIFEYEKNYVNDPTAQLKPSNYTRESTDIRLWPTPDDIYTITLKYYYLPDLLSAPTDVSIYTNQFDELILMGAVWRAYLRLGDYVRYEASLSAYQMRMQSIKLIEQKELRDTHYSGLDVAWAFPDNNTNFPANFNSAESTQRAR